MVGTSEVTERVAAKARNVSAPAATSDAGTLTNGWVSRLPGSLTHHAGNEHGDNDRLGGQDKEAHDDEAGVVLMEPDDDGDTRQGQALDGERPYDAPKGPAPQRHHRAEQHRGGFESEGAGIGRCAHLTTNPLTTPSSARTNAPASNSGTLEQAHFGHEHLEDGQEHADEAHLGGQRNQTDGDVGQMCRRRHAPGGEQIHEDGEQQR